MDELKLDNSKVTASNKAAAGAELAALNDLLKMMNNPALTGASVPPEEKNAVFAPSPAPVLAAPLPPKAVEAVAKVITTTDKPLIVLTGRAGTGKSWLQARLQGTRNVITSITDAADYRALRASGAEFWHVMASDGARARRRSPAAATRAASPLITTLDMDATAKLSKLPPGKVLKVVWNDTVPQPFTGMQNTTAFLNSVS